MCSPPPSPCRPLNSNEKKGTEIDDMMMPTTSSFLLCRPFLSWCATGIWLSVILRADRCLALKQPNVLFIMTYQHRYDALRRVQDELSSYHDKHRIRTPNLDRLSKQGALMKTAYTQCPVCGPARTVLRTGCTIERTGVQTNPLPDDALIRSTPSCSRIKSTSWRVLTRFWWKISKWHISDRLYYRRDGKSPAVQYNDYNFFKASPTFRTSSSEVMLKSYLSYFQNRGDVKWSFDAGQQQDTYSTYPYTPIAVNSRFGKPTNTSMSGFNSFDSDQTSQAGNYSLNKKYSSSFLTHDIALRALNRLAAQKQPFILTVSYHHPHSRYMAPFEYLAYYWDKRDQLFTTPNVHVPLDDSTSYYNVKEQKSLFDAGYCDEDNVKKWAVYYAMIEQIDTLIGIMLDRLDKLGLTNKTLLVLPNLHRRNLLQQPLR
jgi:hypothetical protein